MTLLDFFARYIKPRRFAGKGCLNPAPTGPVTASLTAFRQWDVNYWLLAGEGGYIAFDCGYSYYPEPRADLIAAGIDPGEARALFITHADMDHAGGLVLPDGKLFPNAKLYICEHEEGMLRGKERRFRKAFLRIRNPVAYPGEAVFLKDGETVEVLGHKIRLIHVPGHTPGHSCYLVDDEILVTGDCLAFNRDGGYSFFSFFNMDTARNLASLKKLRKALGKVRPSLWLSGHSGVFAGSPDKAFSHAGETAKGSRARPFDETAPYDCFKNKGR